MTRDKSNLDLTIRGLHHMALAVSSLARSRQFYTQVLGMHSLAGTATPTAMPGPALYLGASEPSQPWLVINEVAEQSKGNWGVGGTHHMALAVQDELALRRWRKWLVAQGVSPTPIRDRKYFQSVYFNDPDGAIVELATLGLGFTVDEPLAALGREPQFPLGRHLDSAKAQTPAPDETPTPSSLDAAMRLLGLHHVSALASDLGRTTDFYVDTLGLRLIKQTINYDDPSVWHLYYGDAVGTPGTVVTYFGYPRMRQARPGPGIYRTIALAVEAGQLEAWQARLQAAGLAVSPIQDEAFFQSVELHDPDGHALKLVAPLTRPDEH